MRKTETWAMRNVCGGELYLRRAPGAGWEVTVYERVLNAPNAIADGVLRSARLFFGEQTFASPGKAANAVRRVVAGLRLLQ